MKKLLALLLVGIMIFSLAACGENTNAPSNSDNPGVSQSGNESGISKKTDLGKTLTPIADEDKDSDYVKFLEASGLQSIGIPEGYSLKGSYSLGSTGYKLTFKSDSGEIGSDDLKLYIAAVWNLLIDVADDNKILNADGEVYNEFSDLGTIKKWYTLYYNLNGTRMFLDFQAESGEIDIISDVKVIVE